MITVQSHSTSAISFGGSEGITHKLAGGSTIEVPASHLMVTKYVNENPGYIKLSDFQEGVDYYFSTKPGLRSSIHKAVVKDNTIIITDVPVRKSLRIITSSRSNITIVRVTENSAVTEVVSAGTFVVRDVADIYTSSGELVTFTENAGVKMGTFNSPVLILKGNTLTVQ
jgi:hypothetical protein